MKYLNLCQSDQIIQNKTLLRVGKQKTVKTNALHCGKQTDPAKCSRVIYWKCAYYELEIHATIAQFKNQFLKKPKPNFFLTWVLIVEKRVTRDSTIKSRGNKTHSADFLRISNRHYNTAHFRSIVHGKHVNTAARLWDRQSLRLFESAASFHKGWRGWKTSSQKCPISKRWRKTHFPGRCSKSKSKDWHCNVPRAALIVLRSLNRRKTLEFMRYFYHGAAWVKINALALKWGSAFSL